MESNLSAFEEKAERDLVTLCQEKKQLLKQAHELKRELLLCQKKRELVDVLNPQVSCGQVSEPCVPAGSSRCLEGLCTVIVTPGLTLS